MAEVIKRIKTDNLTTEEYKFVSDMPLYEAYYGNLQQELEEKLQEGYQKLQEEHQKLQEERRKRKEEQQAVRQKHLHGIEKLLQRGDDIPSIADLLGLTIEETTVLVAEVQAKKA